MIKSMTGYGKKSINTDFGVCNMELRCLNSKQLDVNIKLPQDLKDFENNIRNLISKILERGKIELFVTFENETETAESKLSFENIKKYYSQIVQVTKDLNLEMDSNILSTLLQMPNVFVQEATTKDENFNNILEKTVLELLQSCDEFRIQEGKAMEADLKLRIKNIQELRNQIDSIEKERIVQLREKIVSGIEKYDLSPNLTLDESRFEQEIFWYLEKLDITEEKVRLDNHCKYFIEILNQQESQGKKLFFISQEIGREINTIGSKANHFEIQRIVVEMKDELEKVKEQLSNVL